MQKLLRSLQDWLFWRTCQEPTTCSTNSSAKFQEILGFNYTAPIYQHLMAAFRALEQERANKPKKEKMPKFNYAGTVNSRRGRGGGVAGDQVFFPLRVDFSSLGCLRFQATTALRTAKGRRLSSDVRTVAEMVTASAKSNRVWEKYKFLSYNKNKCL